MRKVLLLNPILPKRRWRNKERFRWLKLFRFFGANLRDFSGSKQPPFSVIRQVKKSKDIRDGFWYLCEWLRCIIVHEKDSHLHLLEKASTYFKDNQEIYFIHELMMYECLRMNNYDACLSHALSLLNDQTVFKSIPPKS